MRKAATLARRTLLQASAAVGLSALVLGGAAASEKEACAKEAIGAEDDVQYGFLCDLIKCVNCKKCVTACRTGNNLSDDTPDRRHIRAYRGAKRKRVAFSFACMHCAEPSCAAVCPAGAISKGAGGIVSVDKNRCIGCKYCFQACPYEVPRYNSVAMDKCDCCLGAGVAVGDTPYCARACKFDALHYGPLDQLREQTGGAAVPIAQANNPSCLVIGERG